MSPRNRLSTVIESISESISPMSPLNRVRSMFTRKSRRVVQTPSSSSGTSSSPVLPSREQNRRQSRAQSNVINGITSTPRSRRSRTRKVEPSTETDTGSPDGIQILTTAIEKLEELDKKITKYVKEIRSDMITLERNRVSQVKEVAAYKNNPTAKKIAEKVLDKLIRTLKRFKKAEVEYNKLKKTVYHKIRDYSDLIKRKENLQSNHLDDDSVRVIEKNVQELIDALEKIIQKKNTDDVAGGKKSRKYRKSKKSKKI